jgi:hypothetical protein
VIRSLGIPGILPCNTKAHDVESEIGQGVAAAAGTFRVNDKLQHGLVRMHPSAQLPRRCLSRIFAMAFPLGLALWSHLPLPSLQASGQEQTSAGSSISQAFQDIDLPEGIEFQAYERSYPRPLRIYRLTIDLSVAEVEPVIAVAPDPDGDGPAETALTSPMTLAQEKHMIVAINSNAWTMIPDPETGKAPGYVPGGHADILGWVAEAGRTISPVQAGYWSFWIDANRRPFLRNIAPHEAHNLTNTGVAISGFGGILAGDQILVAPSEVRHPRTAIGFNAGNQRLVLVVVDGRQPNVSEGVSEEELAKLMVEFGCSEAINLDGGGSSVMLLRGSDGELRFINRSSDKTGVRPVPVVFGFRQSAPNALPPVESPPVESPSVAQDRS